MGPALRQITCEICNADCETQFLHKDICHECAVWEFSKQFDDPKEALTAESKKLLRQRARRLAKSVGVDPEGRKWLLDAAGEPLDFGEAI